MRIVFMGTPEFALPSLTILLEHSHHIAGVVTAPDKPKGRGRQVTPVPVAVAARERGLPLLQPERLDDPSFVASLSALAPDVIVVVAFRILPRSVFSLASKGSFNLHASLLPKYRGAAPINWALINGEQYTGVTTFFLKEAVDTGSVILQARVKIGPDETAGELHDKLAAVGAEIVLQTVRLIELDKASGKPQDDEQASPAPKIFKDDCRVRWSVSAQSVHNLVRGLSPSPTAWTMHNDRLIKIYRTRCEPSVPVSPRARPGDVSVLDGKQLLVATAEGMVSLLEVQQEGRKRMSAEEFLRGYPLRTGDALQ